MVAGPAYPEPSSRLAAARAPHVHRSAYASSPPPAVLICACMLPHSPVQASGCANRAVSTSMCSGRRACQRCGGQALLLAGRLCGRQAVVTLQLLCMAVMHASSSTHAAHASPQAHLMLCYRADFEHHALICRPTSGHQGTPRQSTASRWTAAHALCAARCAPSSMAPSRRLRTGCAGCTR